MKTPTVNCPYVDRYWLERMSPRFVYVNDGILVNEFDLVDATTGVVVYTTPKSGDAENRVLAFAKRNGLTVVADPIKG